MTDQTKIQDKIVGRVVVTIENNKDTNEPIIIKKEIKKVYNQQTGKCEVQSIEIPKKSIEEQITEAKTYVNQASEINKKLIQQHNTLLQQGISLTKILKEKEKNYKEELVKEKEALFNKIKNKAVDNGSLQMPQMTQEQIAQRKITLEKELQNAIAQNKLLSAESDLTAKINTDKDITAEIISLQSKIEEGVQKLKQLKKENREIERISQKNQKELELFENGNDDAAQINSLNKELLMVKEKEGIIENKVEKIKGDSENKQKQIEKYKELIEDFNDNGIENLKNNLSTIMKKWEKKQELLETEKRKNEENEQKDKWLKFKEDKKKREEQDKERIKKEEEKLKEKNKKKDQTNDDDQEKKKIKQVVGQLNEKVDLNLLEINETNFIQLYNYYKQLKEQKEKQDKQLKNEQQQMNTQLNNLKLEKANLQVSIKEKQRTKEMAEQLIKEFEQRINHYLETQKEKQEKADKIKMSGRTQLSPLKGKSNKKIPTYNPQILREEKTEQLKQFKEKFNKQPKEILQKYSQEPFKLSYQVLQEKRKKKQQIEQSDDKEISKQQMVLQKICDTKHRLSKRDWFGYEPNEQTSMCDDVNLLGPFSIKHRIMKLIIYHNPIEGLIYLITAEYKKEDGNILSGKWNINQELFKENKDVQINELDLSEDRVNEIILRRENNFISFIQFNTKKGIIVKAGKEIIEQKEDKPQEKESEEGQPKKQEQEKKEENPDKKIIKLDNFSILITLFNGYIQKQEKEMAMSFFGFEIGKKMTEEEYQLYQEERFKIEQEKEKRRKQKLLEQSLEFSQSSLFRK